MISNSTGMDVFDRGFEPMCYCVNNDGMANFESTAIKSFGRLGNNSVISANTVKELCNSLFYAWHIRRSDLLTLGGR